MRRNTFHQCFESTEIWYTSGIRGVSENSPLINRHVYCPTDSSSWFWLPNVAAGRCSGCTSLEVGYFLILIIYMHRSGLNNRLIYINKNVSINQGMNVLFSTEQFITFSRHSEASGPGVNTCRSGKRCPLQLHATVCPLYLISRTQYMVIFLLLLVI